MTTMHGLDVYKVNLESIDSRRLVSIVVALSQGREVDAFEAETFLLPVKMGGHDRT